MDKIIIRIFGLWAGFANEYRAGVVARGWSCAKADKAQQVSPKFLMSQACQVKVFDQC